MQFPPNFLDEIRSRLRLSEIVRRKVNLRQTGHEFSGLCPFHKEKSSSFTVNDEKGFYHCFGCAAHGDAIKFVMETEGLPFVDAVTQLAGQAGLALPKVDKHYAERQQKAQSLYEIMEHATQWFIAQLATNQGETAREYLQKRGLKASALAKFRIGYAPDQRHALKKYLEDKGVKETQMLEAGLLVKNERGESYDKFRGRIMFPIADSKNRVIAFGGRALGDGKPKYLNSPETPLFKKGEILYNENNARTLAFKTGKIVVAEGYMDVIALDSAGIKTGVAPLGTAVTESHLRRLWQMAEEPVICLDGDAAGMRAMDRTAHLAMPLLEPGYTLKFALLPEKMDPDDYIKQYGAAHMRKALQQAAPLSETLWEAESTKTNVQTPERKAELEKRLNDLAEKIKNPSIQKYYKDFFRAKLWEFYKTKQRKDASPAKKTQFEQMPDFNIQSASGCQTALLLLVWSCPKLLHDVEVWEEFHNIEFSSEKLDKIGQAILEVSGEIEEIHTKDVKTHLENAGFSADISYLEGLRRDLLLEENMDLAKAILAWKYYSCLRQLLQVRRECQDKEQEMTEESEQTVIEFRKQITLLELEVGRMEMAFGDE